MTSGIDIIYTKYSGHTEFANGRSIIPSRLEVAEDGVWFNGTGKWMMFDDSCIDQTVAHMRDAFKNRSLARTYSMYTEHLTWKNSAQKLLTSL